MTPLRVVSLVPSHSETLAALGADLVGVTRYCTVPASLDRLPRVGGTKDPDPEAVAALGPDLVVANAEENRREDVAALEAAGVRVLVTLPRTVSEGSDSVVVVGEAAGVGDAAAVLVDRLRYDLAALVADPPAGPPPGVFAPVWRRPWVVFNADTYAHDVLTLAGGGNVFASFPDRYPRVELADALEAGAEVALLSDEPFSFASRHAEELRSAGLRVAFCSGQDLHWYGPRTVAGIRRVREALGAAR